MMCFVWSWSQSFKKKKKFYFGIWPRPAEANSMHQDEPAKLKGETTGIWINCRTRFHFWPLHPPLKTLHPFIQWSQCWPMVCTQPANPGGHRSVKHSSSSSIWSSPRTWPLILTSDTLKVLFYCQKLQWSPTLLTFLLTTSSPSWLQLKLRFPLESSVSSEVFSNGDSSSWSTCSLWGPRVVSLGSRLLPSQYCSFTFFQNSFL